MAPRNHDGHPIKPQQPLTRKSVSIKYNIIHSPRSPFSICIHHTLFCFRRAFSLQSLIPFFLAKIPTMQFKNSMLLLTALSAGSAVARLHGHERRHAHPKNEVELDLEPATPLTTTLPKVEGEVEPRAVGDVVSAIIDGVLVTWINEWSGEVNTAASSSSTSTSISVEVPTSTPTVTLTPAADKALPSEVESTVSAVPTSNPSGGSWHETPSNGDYSTEGFGKRTSSSDTHEEDWSYKGNVGSPWGSNIIEIEEHKASQYKHVLRFEGSDSETWTVVFWNTYGPTGGMNGFWNPNKALSFEIEKGQTKYVAIDENSQGGWAAAPGNIPTSEKGQYASTWGEFDMSNEKNEGHSGWDVSCIIAQLADLTVQGMRICNHEGQKCSKIGKGLLGLLNAYTKADQGNPSLAVSQTPGPVRLVVNLDYADL